MPELHPGITTAGPGHPRVRQYLRLKSNRRGEEVGRIALEGTWLLGAAADRAVPLDAVLVCTELLRGPLAQRLVRRLHDGGVPVFAVSAKTFGRLTNRDGPDGLLAIARYREPNLDALAVSRISRVLVLDRFE